MIHKRRHTIIFFYSAWTFYFLSAGNLIKAGEQIVATVNGAKIKQQALTAEINKKLPYASYHSGVSKEKFQEIRKQALENLIEDELLFQEAVRQKLTVSPQKMAQRIQVMQNGFPTKKAFNKALAKAGLNLQGLQYQVKKQLLVKKLLQKEVYNQVVVKTSTLRAYYNANKKKFILPERYRMGHILISVDPAAMKAGWEAGLKKAENVYSRLLSGEDFAKIANEVSDDTTTNKQGGDSGWFHKGQLLPELEKAIENLKIGEISKPIRTIYGYHIIKLGGHQPAKQLSFDEIDREGLKKRLFQKKVQDLKRKLLNKLKAQADIRIKGS